MGYSYYYDTPEGKDCDKKLALTTKYALGASMIYSTYDVLFFAKTQGYAPTAARFAYNAFPFVGCAAAFTAVGCMSTSLRGKSDYLNYILAGATAGSIIGAWKQRASLGMGCAAIFAVFGAVMHNAIDENWEFFPNVKINKLASIDPTDFKNDYSLAKTTIQPHWTTK